jgi:hypothetical protein
MKKSGLADSPFFNNISKSASLPVKPKERKEARKSVKRPRQSDTMTPRNRDTTQPSNHDTTIPRYHEQIVEAIRRAVKELGKEAATHRFTVDEKKTISDLIYSYKRLGIRTSENEITRIAINFIINDYKENGKNSVLEKALKALNK